VRWGPGRAAGSPKPICATAKNSVPGLRYRSLFDELLEADDGQATVTARRGPGHIVGQADANGSGLDRHVGGQGANESPDTTS
jgi:hypothetical protein